MATTVEPRDETQPYVDADEYIDFQLAKTQSQIKATEILTSASWLGLASLAYVLTFVVLDQWVMPGGFGTVTRAIWLGGLLLVGGAWLTTRILMPWFRTIHELYAAKAIESADPTLKSSLLNLIDLQIHNRKSQSPLVRTSMEKRAAVELSRVDVDHAVDRQALLRVAYSLLGMLVVCSLYVMLSPKDAFSSVQRLLLPASHTAVATRTAIANISPEDTRVLAGELLTVEADIIGQMPAQVSLVYTTADREFVNQPVEMQRVEEGTSRFRGVISGEKGRGLMQNITYRLEAGDARSRDYNVEVLEPPTSNVESINYTFPTYMKFEPKQRPGGHIDAWEGTKLALTATTNLPVQSAMLVMTDTDNPLAKGEEIRMKITNGKQLSAEWTLEFRSDGTFARYYHIECKTAAGETDPHPKVYSIKIQPDQRPEVSLLHPTQDLERPANAVVPLLVKAADPDFLLRFITLKVKKGGEVILSTALLDVGEERATFEGTHDLQLEKLSAGGLQPGDEILYWIEARDNKQPHGNRSATPPLKIKITAPAKAEQLAEQLEADRQKQQQKADEANSDTNPLDPNRPPPDAAQEKEQRPRQPKEQKPEQKPGDPKPRENAQQPDDAEQKPEEDPNQPQQPPKQADGEQKQPAQGDKNKQQPGQKEQGPPQPGDKPTGKPQPGKDGAAEENSQNGPQKPDGKSDKQDKANKPSDDAGKPDPAPKKQRPANTEEALKKLLEREQQQADSNSEESGKDSKPGADPSGKPADAEQKSPSDNKTPNQKPSPKDDKTSKPKDGSEESPSNPDPSKPGQNQAQKKKGTEKPNSPTDGQPPQPGERSNNPPKPSNKKAGEKNEEAEKPNTDPQNDASKPGQENKPSPNGKPQPGDDKNGKTQPGESNPNGQPMPKPEAGKKPGDPDPKGENSPDTTPGEAAKDPKDPNAAAKPGDKPGDKPVGKKDPMGAKPQSPDDKAGDGAQAPGDEKNAGKKQPGPANKSTKDNGPEGKDAPEQGPGNGKKPEADKKPGATPKQNPEKSPESVKGEETPAEDGKDAQKRVATGKENGPADGQDKPEGPAPKAENDLERKPDSKSGAMRESDNPKDPNAKPEAGSKAAKSTKAKPDGSRRVDDPMKQGTEKTKDQEREKRPGSKPSQEEPNPGKGTKNQKSQKPDSGEEGGGTPQDKGTPGSKEEGKGDTTPKPGDQTPAAKDKDGKPGDTPGEGKKTQPAPDGKGEKQPGDGEPSADKPDGQPMPGEWGKPGDDGKPGNSKPGSDQPGKPGDGKPGDGKPGTGKGQPGKPGQSGKGGPSAAPGEGGQNDDPPGNEAANGAGKPNPKRENLPPAEREQEAQEAAEKANEEFARKASNLVLKKLRKDLERGEVDQELLDELGWKKEDMERFVKHLEQQLADTGEDNSPEALARRRQFEETLKTLGLSSKTKLRKANRGKATRVNELGDRKIAPPPEYQELFEEYTKDLAKPAAKAKK